MVKLSKLVTLATCLALFSAVGCKTKKEREKEEAAAEATQKERSQQEAQQRAKEDEQAKQLQLQKAQQQAVSAAVRAAELDQEERLRIYKGVEGLYAGTYAGRSGTPLSISAKLAIENLPSDIKKERPTTESDIITATEAIALSAEVSVTAPGATAGSLMKIFTCTSTAIKPDFSRGTMKFLCTPLSGGAARTFKVLFSQISPLDSGETPEFASLRLAEDLVQNRIETIETLQFEFSSNEGIFRGKVRR